jgi:hypothetical protein
LAEVIDITNIADIANIKQPYGGKQNIAECGRLWQIAVNYNRLQQIVAEYSR